MKNILLVFPAFDKEAEFFSKGMQSLLDPKEFIVGSFNEISGVSFLFPLLYTLIHRFRVFWYITNTHWFQNWWEKHTQDWIEENREHIERYVPDIIISLNPITNALAVSIAKSINVTSGVYIHDICMIHRLWYAWNPEYIFLPLEQMKEEIIIPKDRVYIMPYCVPKILLEPDKTVSIDDMFTQLQIKKIYTITYWSQDVPLRIIKNLKNALKLKANILPLQEDNLANMLTISDVAITSAAYTHLLTAFVTDTIPCVCPKSAYERACIRSIQERHICFEYSAHAQLLLSQSDIDNYRERINRYIQDTHLFTAHILAKNIFDTILSQTTRNSV